MSQMRIFEIPRLEKWIMQMLVQSDANIFLQLHKKRTTTYTSPPKLANFIPQKKTMKNQIFKHSCQQTLISHPWIIPTKKTMKNKIFTSKKKRVPSRERSTITYSPPARSWEACLHHRRSGERLNGFLPCRTCPPKGPFKKWYQHRPQTVQVNQWISQQPFATSCSSFSQYVVLLVPGVKRTAVHDWPLFISLSLYRRTNS